MPTRVNVLLGQALLLLGASAACASFGAGDDDVDPVVIGDGAAPDAPSPPDAAAPDGDAPVPDGGPPPPCTIGETFDMDALPLGWSAMVSPIRALVAFGRSFPPRLVLNASANSDTTATIQAWAEHPITSPRHLDLTIKMTAQGFTATKDAHADLVSLICGTERVVLRRELDQIVLVSESSQVPGPGVTALVGPFSSAWEEIAIDFDTAAARIVRNGATSATVDLVGPLPAACKLRLGVSAVGPIMDTILLIDRVCAR